MPEGRVKGQDRVLATGSQLLEEIQSFADGDVNHVFYPKEDGPGLVIPPIKDKRVGLVLLSIIKSTRLR